MHVLGHRAILDICQATGRTVVSLFVDVKGAYPSMDWRALEYLLRKYGIPDDAVRAYMNRLRRTRISVRDGKHLSACIDVDKGLQQGQVSAPLSWNIYYDPLLRRISRLIPGVRINFVRRADGPPASESTSDGAAAAAASSSSGDIGEAAPLEEAPDRAFADDLVIYFDFDGTPTQAQVAERLRDTLAILSDYERDFNVELGLGVKKTAIIVWPHNAAALPAAERELWCSPAFPPVPIPAPGSVWTREGARIALSRDGEGGAAAAALPVHAAPTLPSPPRPAPPAVRAVSAVKQYKYLGDVSSNDQSYAAARVTFAHRLANKLKQILGRLFAYNRVTLKLRVATKMQLLGTLMLGATSYLLAVHRLTATDLEHAEAPIRRALMEILGLPARGAMAVVAMMEAPAVVPFTTLSLTHRMRLLCTLHGTPHFATSPPASLVQHVTGAHYAPLGLGGALLPADRVREYAPIPDVGALNAVAGFTFPRDTLTELSEMVRPADRFVGVPNVDWRPPTTARGIIPAIRYTACASRRASISSGTST